MKIIQNKQLEIETEPVEVWSRNVKSLSWNIQVY
jgi:hypothetical protein